VTLAPLLDARWPIALHTGFGAVGPDQYGGSARVKSAAGVPQRLTGCMLPRHPRHYLSRLLAFLSRRVGLEADRFVNLFCSLLRRVHCCLLSAAQVQCR
jgi:hypothetical protein